MAEKDKPTEDADTPVREPEAIPKQVSAEDRLAAMVKDQEKSQKADAKR